MRLDVVSYHDLLKIDHRGAKQAVTAALYERGVVGIKDVPSFLETSESFVNAARAFSTLSEAVKKQYAARREVGNTEGYELGAEWFKDENGEWQIDDKKASYYAFVPNQPDNQWPSEIDLKTPYLALGELIFNTGKLVLDAIGLNRDIGINHTSLRGYARMLHYQKVGDATDANPLWCGAHYDHDIFTGLTPGHYFKDGIAIDEPEEAGLFIKSRQSGEFEKIEVPDKSIMLFQVGEFGQLATNDKIRATKHLVKKAKGDIERFTMALFYSTNENVLIHPTSELTNDIRYTKYKQPDGSLYYQDWDTASFDQYHATKDNHQT